MYNNNEMFKQLYFFINVFINKFEFEISLGTELLTEASKDGVEGGGTDIRNSNTGCSASSIATRRAKSSSSVSNLDAVESMRDVTADARAGKTLTNDQ